ncbi:MAG: hypothetical protein ACE5E5_06370 [Phycisphaerae bacterium]
MTIIKSINHTLWPANQRRKTASTQSAQHATDLQRPVAIPIVPRAGIYLIPSGHSEDARFCGVFRRTWRAIPPGARRRLLTHWHWRMGADTCYGSPRIELFEHWYLVSHARPDTVGVCDMRGRRFRFSAPMLRHMPDEIAAELIAHELAHALQYARLRPRLSTETWEAEARDIERAWGFDPCGASAWYFTNEHRLDGRPTASPRCR